MNRKKEITNMYKIPLITMLKSSTNFTSNACVSYFINNIYIYIPPCTITEKSFTLLCSYFLNNDFNAIYSEKDVLGAMYLFELV